MKKIVIAGAGKIGQAITKHLSQTNEYDLLVIDRVAKVLEQVSSLPNITTQCVDLQSQEQLKKVLQCDCVISACSFDINQLIAQAAVATGCSYFDLTEDVATTEAIQALAQQAKPGQIFMPQCGLAPGFIGILAYHVSKQFDTLDKVKLRVGALPLYPSNMMKYNLTWSTDGLINEYCNPCHAIDNAKAVQLMPLEGLEHFSLDGISYEAFNTSGGLGPLYETLSGKVNQLDYKTVRYEGHCELMRFLVRELKLENRREILKDILEQAVPITRQDVVLVFVSVSGQKKGVYTQVVDARKIYHQNVYGEEWSSIQVTTASAVCAVVELFFQGRLPKQGYVRQEQVNLDDFLNNRFGQYFNV